MASSLYDTGRNMFAGGYVQWRSGGSTTQRISLISTTYNPVVGDNEYADCSTNIVGTTGTLANCTRALGVCDADNYTFSSVSSGTTDNLVIYLSGSVDSMTDPLVCWIEYSSVTANGGDITIQWDDGTNKIFKL